MKIDRWINTHEELVEFKKAAGLRDDWHEPDEQNIDARLSEQWPTFDNAFGDDSEQHVILYNMHTTESVAINLATLLAWATGYRG
jgi:hypothetical protein